MTRPACKTPSPTALKDRNDLIEANLGLVRSIAKRIAHSLPPSFELDDLVQTGYLGLLAAATRYQPSKHGGTPFSAYARPVIHGTIIDSVRRGAYVESTRPSAALLPERAIETVHDAELDAQTTVRKVRREIAKLPRRHARVVKLHYQGEMRLAAIAPVLAVGKSRASQLHMEAVRALRVRLAS